MNEISSRKLKAAETKERIYNSAEILFSEFGFGKVSVDSIVAKAGISKGDFYVHFDSKNALIADVLTKYVSKSDMDYQAYLESFSKNTKASIILVSLIERICENITNHIGYNLMKNAYMLQIDRPGNTGMLLDYHRQLYQTFSSLITLGIEQGEFKKDISTDTISNHFVMALRGFTYEWCIRYPDFDFKEQVLQHFDILLNGIKI